MRNVRLTLSYDGTAYAGWQAQAGAATIQGEVEAAIGKMTGEAVRLTGSGRTDAGVHAEGQTANFHTGRDIPLKGFVQGLNSLLPPDISIRRADEMPPGFDSRRSARKKTYRYRLWNAPTPSALERRTSWWVSRPLDLGAMERALAALTGVHDFAGLRSAGCDAKTTVREITEISLRRAGECVEIAVTGTGFLRHMVRVIVGTAVEVGEGRRGEDAFARLLEAGDRNLAGITAPPQGLRLVSVVYEECPLDSYPAPEARA